MRRNELARRGAGGDCLCCLQNRVVTPTLCEVGSRGLPIEKDRPVYAKASSRFVFSSGTKGR